MDQPLVTPATVASHPEREEPAIALAILPAALAEHYRDGPFIVVVRTGDEFARWLSDPLPGAEGLEVHGLLIGELDPWLLAAQGTVPIPLDVMVGDPAGEYSALYRLVDVRNARDVRVTISAKPGLFKALRLAVSLQLPVRLLPGQPDKGTLAELFQALEFYLRDPMVETPVEFFHSTLAASRGLDDGSLWQILEHDPAGVSVRNESNQPLLPPDFVESHLRRLLEAGAECAGCRWQSFCRGYFKHPDPSYDCAGVKELLDAVKAAGDEMTRDLAAWESPSPHE
jgi:hypothetical protein